MSWKAQKAISTLAVSHLDAAIEFYSRLGCTLDWRWPDGNPTHAELMLGDCSLMLCECDPDERGDVYFIVDDVAACHTAILQGKCWELAEAAGQSARRADCPPKRSLSPPEPPQDKEYGLRDFSIVDPWGHLLTFGQPLQSQDA